MMETFRIIVVDNGVHEVLQENIIFVGTSDSIQMIQLRETRIIVGFETDSIESDSVSVSASLVKKYEFYNYQRMKQCKKLGNLQTRRWVPQSCDQIAQPYVVRFSVRK
jgi:hypothetical protein